MKCRYIFTNTCNASALKKNVVVVTTWECSGFIYILTKQNVIFLYHQRQAYLTAFLGNGYDIILICICSFSSVFIGQSDSWTLKVASAWVNQMAALIWDVHDGSFSHILDQCQHLSDSQSKRSFASINGVHWEPKAQININYG